MLPKQFREGNEENIFIYHYVEELIISYNKFTEERYDDEDITLPELPYLLRIGIEGEKTQKELFQKFNVSEGYTAKLLRKFEDTGLIERFEDPTNHRQKIVRLTEKGLEKIQKANELIQHWENTTTSNLTPEEVKILKKLLFKAVT